MADIHIRLDDDHLRSFKAWCAEQGQTMSEVLRGMIWVELFKAGKLPNQTHDDVPARQQQGGGEEE